MRIQHLSHIVHHASWRWHNDLQEGELCVFMMSEAWCSYLLPRRWLPVFCPPRCLVSEAMAARSSCDRKRRWPWRVLLAQGVCEAGRCNEVSTAISKAFIIIVLYCFTLRSSRGTQQASEHHRHEHGWWLNTPQSWVAPLRLRWRGSGRGGQDGGGEGGPHPSVERLRKPGQEGSWGHI